MKITQHPLVDKWRLAFLLVNSWTSSGVILVMNMDVGIEQCSLMLKPALPGERDDLPCVACTPARGKVCSLQFSVAKVNPVTS